MISLCFARKLNNQKKHLQEELEKQKDNSEISLIDKQIQDYQQEILKQETEIKNMQENIDAKIDYVLEQLKIEYKMVDFDTILETMDLKSVKQQLEEVQEALNHEKLLLNTIEHQEKEITSQLENQISLEEEYENLKEECEILEKESMCISLTKEYLNKAYEKMKNTITPKFTQNLSETMAVISHQKYRKSKCK